MSAKHYLWFLRNGLCAPSQWRNAWLAVD